jgi:D-glycero-D-manno-heptose 1,7-bisphosphate phosphatase
MTALKAVFLDRDGIINRAIVQNGKPYPPASLDELDIIPGTLMALQQLASSGFLLLGVTNQPDVARGIQTREVVEAINSHIMNILPLKEILVCYHDKEDHCACRKPKPGLILQGAEKYDIDLGRSWMVGDRWKDISAGKVAGLKTVFVNYNYSEAYDGPPADFTIQDMAMLTEIILDA